MGGKALIVQGIQNKQDREKGQFLRQHFEMLAFTESNQLIRVRLSILCSSIGTHYPVGGLTPPGSQRTQKICCFHRNSEHTA